MEFNMPQPWQKSKFGIQYTIKRGLVLLTRIFLQKFSKMLKRCLDKLMISGAYTCILLQVFQNATLIFKVREILRYLCMGGIPNTEYFLPIFVRKVYIVFRILKKITTITCEETFLSCGTTEHGLKNILKNPRSRQPLWPWTDFVEIYVYRAQYGLGAHNTPKNILLKMHAHGTKYVLE